MEAVIQIEAAVVSPLTEKPSDAASTKKTDAAHDALDHAARGVVIGLSHDRTAMPIVDADEHQLARCHADQGVLAKARLSTSVAAFEPDHPASQQGSKEPDCDLDVSTVHQRAPAVLDTLGSPWCEALLAQVLKGASPHQARCLSSSGCLGQRQATPGGAFLLLPLTPPLRSLA